MRLTFSKAKKTLKIECGDPAFCTPFQPHVVADILNGIWELTDSHNETKFEYFKSNGEWGFRAKKKTSEELVENGRNNGK